MATGGLMPNDTEELWFQGDDTLKKVYAGLLEVGIFGQQAVEAVDAIEKQGIFFREKKPKRRGRPPRIVETKPTPAVEVVETTEKQGDPWAPNPAEQDGLNGG